MYIEKEGFDELIIRSRIAERFDLMRFSSKGQSTTATRELVDKLSQAGRAIFVLHDFDEDGMRIRHWLSHDNERYTYKVKPTVIDIGLRLADVRGMKLESETVDYVQEKNPASILRSCDDITEDEIKFLVSPEPRVDPQTRKTMWSGRRVELNAMTSRQLISFIERKLEENGVEKVVPDRATLKIAWRREQKIRAVNAAIRRAMGEINGSGWTVPAAPRDLATQVRKILRRDPLLPWDAALAQIAAKRG